MGSHVLGVDPGRESGAAVLLSGSSTVAAWWSWKRLKRKGGEVWRVTESEPGGVVEDFGVSAMWAVGRYIGDQVEAITDPDLVIEGLFVPRRRRGQRPVDPQSVIPLAEATGELVGGLRMTPALRPLATEWRSDQLGLRPRHDAKGAEAYAVRMAAQVFDWPDGAKAPTQEERGALAEAAFIARYGWVRLAAGPAGRARKPDG